MLILSRTEGDDVFFILPDKSEIKISIVDIRANRIRLGIEAGKEVKIIRGEIRRQEERNEG